MLTTKDLPRLLTTEQAAEFLQISPATLVSWRRSNGPPPYHRIGRRIRYAVGDLIEFIEGSGPGEGDDDDGCKTRTREVIMSLAGEKTPTGAAAPHEQRPLRARTTWICLSHRP